MKKLILVLISIVLLILDNSFAPFIAIKGIHPSFLFTFAIAYSIINGKKEAVTIGVISGLLQDIFFFSGFGVNALVNMLICLIAGVVGDGIFRSKKLIPVITIYFTTILRYVGLSIILYFVNRQINVLDGVFIALYNSVIMFLIYKPVFKFSNMESKSKGWRF